jgi:hypothetical protein
MNNCGNASSGDETFSQNFDRASSIDEVFPQKCGKVSGTPDVLPHFCDSRLFVFFVSCANQYCYIH